MVRTEKELEDLEKKLAKESKELEAEKQKITDDKKKFSTFIESKIQLLQKKEKESVTDARRGGKITKITEPVSVFKCKKPEEKSTKK